MPTRELIACYRELHDNREKFIKLNAQIEDSPNKNFYKKICLLLDRLRRQETREQQQLKVNEFKAAAEMAEMKSISEKRDAAAAATAQQQKELEDSLEASRRNLGKDPTDTVALLRKLADLFLKKYEYDRALPLYEECLDISKRVLGEDHPHTLIYLNDIANLFYMKGDYNRALLLYEDLLAKQRQVLGEEGTGASLGGRSKNKRNHKNKSFRSTRRRRYSRARGGKKIAASSSKTIKRRRKNAR